MGRIPSPWCLDHVCTGYIQPVAEFRVACRSASDYINGVFYAAIAYDTSGGQIQNGCLPTMRVRVPTSSVAYTQHLRAWSVRQLL